MALFSIRILRRSPRRRKGKEQRRDEDDVKIAIKASLQQDNEGGGSRAIVVSSDIANGEVKRRRRFNKHSSLLHSLRNRFAGKPQSSALQRGAASQHEVRVAIFNLCAFPQKPFPQINSELPLMEPHHAATRC
ncbi:hypothetical protein L209DRAFT_758952 [Thermothelomyces heterothallicus CBS 203.75]